MARFDRITVLRWPIGFVAKRFRGVPGPVGIAEHFPAHEDRIRSALIEDVLGLLRVVDEPDGGRGDPRVSPDCLSKGPLAAGTGRDPGIGDHPARRDIQEVDAVSSEQGR